MPRLSEQILFSLFSCCLVCFILYAFMYQDRIPQVYVRKICKTFDLTPARFLKGSVLFSHRITFLSQTFRKKHSHKKRTKTKVQWTRMKEILQLNRIKSEATKQQQQKKKHFILFYILFCLTPNFQRLASCHFKYFRTLHTEII